ncbi:MAG: glycosyltransferase family 4 protein [Chloroflexaceae bacterium]|nr:glycosyltransferase family 4 protein [Chloroflexaceae bacterium]
MHIAYLTAEYPPQPGGVGDYTRCLARALVQQGACVTVLTGQNEQTNDAASVIPASGQPDLVAGIRRWNWYCWRDTIAALDRLRPDILHIQYQTGAYDMHPAINLLPWRLHQLPGRPRLLVTFHDVREPYLFPKAGPLRRWVNVRLARDADQVIVTNQEDAARLLQNQVQSSTLPIGSNISVNPPPGYQRDAWRKHLGVAPDDFLIAYFGLLSPNKGFDLLLQAFHQLIQSLPDHVSRRLRLFLVGGSATNPTDRAFAAAIENQLQSLNLSAYLLRTGYLDERAVSAHLLAADCAVLPFREGASLRSGSLLAVMAHGLATITTLNPSPPTPLPQGERGVTAVGNTLPTLVDGKHALLVPSANVRDLSAALQRLMQDHTLRQSLGAAAQTFVRPFAWDTIAQQHRQLYQSLKPTSSIGHA